MTRIRTVPGSARSVARARAWWAKRSTQARVRRGAADRLRHIHARGTEANCLAIGCLFYCRGCLRWQPWAQGGDGAGPEPYLCDRCANAHEASS